jgi:hypothetical protein
MPKTTPQGGPSNEEGRVPDDVEVPAEDPGEDAGEDAGKGAKGKPAARRRGRPRKSTQKPAEGQG